MSSNQWKTWTLKEAATIVDSLHKTPNYITTGYPMVRAADIKAGFLKLDNALRVSENDFIEFTKKYQPKRGDIVFSRVGSYFVTSYVATDEKFCMGQNTIVLVPKINSRYLFYFLNSQEVNNQIEQLAAGTSQRTIGIGSIKTIKIGVPCIELQEKIASILSSLDDKIELNRQTNQTLEAIAQSIFKEWFVDFNFPGATGKMQESELGEIPKGWKVWRIGELVDTVSITHKFPKGEAIFLNTSDIEEGKILHSSYSDKQGLLGQAKKSIKKLDILFTEIRPANKRYALVDFDADDYVVSTKLMVLRGISNVHPIVVYNYLTNDNTLKELQHLAEARSGTFPQITFDQVRELKLVLPDGELLTKYEKTAWSIFHDIKNNEEQTKTLTQLRDSLLPKLMKGEIKI